jgi:large subunit ribosomal protein L4
VVDNFEVTEPKSKEFRKTLHKLNAKGTTLLVESASSENHNLHLSSRNLAGVELLAGNQVHPYHLLRYETTIFARPALEKLQDSLKASAPKRNHAEVV